MARIAILGGAGQQGGGLARRFARAGERVVVGSRDPERARTTVGGWGEAAAAIEVADYAAATGGADVIVLALPFTAFDALIAEVAPRLAPGTVVIDVMVPVTFSAGKMAMLEVAEGSAAEHVRARLPDTVRLAVAFKTLPAHLLASDAALDCDEFVCGDSDEARAEATRLVELLPQLRAVDVGPLARSRSIEQMTALAIAVNRRHKIHDARFRIVGLR